MLQLLSRLSSNAPDLPFAVRFWDDQPVRYGKGEPAFTLIFHTNHAVKRVLATGVLGFGEEYMAGSIDVEGDFQKLMRLGTDSHVQDISLPVRTRLAVALLSLISAGSLARSPRNVAHHYNRGNEFYKLYLDETLTYSCAYFKTENDSLEQAQQQKYQHICRKLQLHEGETLMDVGCGWGGMLLHAAREHGARPTGCTLSEPQYEYARESIQHQGLSDRATVLLEDYRNIEGTFDKWVSIGMFEHVGKRYIPLFMRTIARQLTPGGLGLLHTIGKERDTTFDPWTRKYVFPGYYLPTLQETVNAMGEAGLVPIDIENLRLHYARTLEAWAVRFEQNAGKIQQMFGESFVRMWRMFLNGSMAGFRWGEPRLYQITFTNGLNNALPLTREHLYA
jgi:cyclopropane-fatty-acyl-phospholipid synthase